MKLWYSFLKDLRLSFKSYYIYLELLIALLFVAVVMFVVPENLERTMTAYARSDDPRISVAWLDEALREDGLVVKPVASDDELRASLERDRSGIGIRVGVSGDKPRIEFVLQGYENERLRNMLRTSVETSFARAMPGFRDSTTVTTLEADPEILSDRMTMLPLFLAMNAGFMGLFIVAAYIFLDKAEGTIKAFAVTPAKVWHYLAGKLGVIMVTGFLTAFISTALVAGNKAHYLHLAPLLAATNAFGTALGLFIASFFDDMTSALGWLFTSIIVLGMAGVSYYMPAFSPLAIRLLPSYPMLFAFRELFLRSPNLGYVYANVGGFTAGAVLLFLLAERRIRRSLTA